MTSVSEVYDAFFGLITDDMYLEITEEETHEECLTFLRKSIPMYEFPKAPIKVKVDEDGEATLNRDLSDEEINILAYGMIQIWLQRQMSTIELVRQKFSGVDFKLTSQASHLKTIMSLFQLTKDEHRRLQMLDSRREEVPDGKGGTKYKSNFDLFVKRMY